MNDPLLTLTWGAIAYVGTVIKHIEKEQCHNFQVKHSFVLQRVYTYSSTLINLPKGGTSRTHWHGGDQWFQLLLIAEKEFS